MSLDVSGAWFRSTRCGAESSCVEVAFLADGHVGIRDSKLPEDSPHLAVDPSAWRAFLRGVKAGEFGTS